MKKKYLIGTGIVLVLLAAILLGAGQYMLNYSLRPDNRGRDLAGSWQYMFDTYPYLKSWKDSLQNAGALKDTFIYAPDDVKMHAYYVAAAQPTAKTAVIVHGYTDNAIRMMMIGYMYNKELGFNILLPDLRDTGLSGGDAIQMGWLDRKDVIQWMNTANEIYGDSTRMVVHGISMGAATTMMVSGEPQPGYVKCFVADCGYTLVRIYQCVGPVLQRTESPVRPTPISANVHCRPVMPAGIRMGIQRSIRLKASGPMPPPHVLHPRRQR